MSLSSLSFFSLCVLFVGHNADYTAKKQRSDAAKPVYENHLTVLTTTTTIMKSMYYFVQAPSALKVSEVFILRIGISEKDMRAYQWLQSYANSHSDVWFTPCNEISTKIVSKLTTINTHQVPIVELPLMKCPKWIFNVSDFVKMKKRNYSPTVSELKKKSFAYNFMGEIKRSDGMISSIKTNRIFKRKIA